jgi:hypothetical protein
MAGAIAWGFGLAGSGVDSATLYPDFFTADVVWLSSLTGNNANAGTRPEAPVATMAQAYTNVSAAGVIAVAAGHTEILSSSQTFAKSGVRVVGFGTGANRPTFTPTSGATNMFFVSGATDVVFENLYFKPAQATSGAGGRLVFDNGANGSQALNCQFDCGASDQNGLLMNASVTYARIDSCTFNAVAATPTAAINAASTTTLTILNTVVSGGGIGWASDPVVVTSATRLVVKNLTITNDASLVGTSMTSYQMFGVTTSGAGRVKLT